MLLNDVFSIFFNYTLIKAVTFFPPGRKELLRSDIEYEVILIDVTETPIERPQKNKENITQERKKAYIENAAGDKQKNA